MEIEDPPDELPLAMEEGIPMAPETKNFMVEGNEVMPSQDEELVMTEEDEDFLGKETDEADGSAPAIGGRRKRNILAIAIILTVVVAEVVVVVLLVGGKDKDGSSSSSNKSIKKPNDTTDAPAVNAPKKSTNAKYCHS